MDETDRKDSILSKELLHVRGVTIRLGATLLILIGLGIVAVSYLLEPDQVTTAPAKLVTLRILVGIMRTIGATLFASGSVDVLIEFPNVVKYIRARIQEALLDHGPVFNRLFDDLLKRDIGDAKFLDAQSDEFIDHVRHSVIQRRLHTQVYEDWQSYVTLADEIEPLLGGVVYKNLKIDITNEVRTDRGVYIHSERYYRAEYTTHAERELDLGFTRRLGHLPGFSPQEQYQLVELIIDDSSALGPIAYADAPNGDCTASIEIPHTIKPGQTLVVERREIAELPPTDVYIWACRPQRSLLCLVVDIRFTNRDLYPRIAALGFPKRETHPREYKRSAHLTWEGWMLPHHGFVISHNDPTPAPEAAPL